AVALFQIRTGNRIGSDALIADGLHARIDGLTSLVVLVAVAGSALGYPIVDPIVGLLIGLAIVFIARDAAKRIWYRLMDAVDPMVVDRIEQYAGDIPGVKEVVSIRVRWVGNQLHAEVAIRINERLTFAETYAVVSEVRHALISYVRHLSVVTVEALPSSTRVQRGAPPSKSAPAISILPPRYQAGGPVSAAPMGAAALQYDTNGDVAWDEMWTGYCELALAGGAPHRGTLLEPVHEAAISADPDKYEWVLQELERGISLVTGLPVLRSDTPGWIGIECDNEAMALWLLRAIVVENVTVRREESALWFPAGPHFRLEREIKNVITVIAKTNHYWQEHVAGGIPDTEMAGAR
ncbi:MAG: cation diffusion facilitator family transporter, partial [Thermomicrobiales bacterium]